MTDQHLNIKTVAVIGAGVSGVAAAIHLNRAGLKVTVFERTIRAGGVWVYDHRVANDASYPSTLPSTGDSPEYERVKKKTRRDSAKAMGDQRQGQVQLDAERQSNLPIIFAPPGPCYVSLKNNVSTIEMEMTSQRWREGTEEFVPHHVLADYIQDSAAANGVLDSIRFDTRVDDISKTDDVWRVSLSELVESQSGFEISTSVEVFDAVVVASGHYHACNIPEIPGLSEWKRAFPNQVRHSKLYRSPEMCKDKNVLLIGAGVSSTDIARDLGGVAHAVFQSSRSGPFDIPSHVLPPNVARVGAIDSFEVPISEERKQDGTIPAKILLKSGEELCGIHEVIVCTGYYVSLPFFRQGHADGVRPQDAGDEVLVTTGQQVHNLHKDIWYIPDPTLAFIGVPYHVATFSLFDFQAIALAKVFSSQVPLLPEQSMRQEYRERVKRKGAGRFFHSLRPDGAESAYVRELADMISQGNVEDLSPAIGHSEQWHEAYQRRKARQAILFSKTRDPSLDKHVMSLIGGC